MPSVKELIEDRIKNIESKPAQFITDVEKAQKQIYSRILDKLDKLDVDENGLLTQSNNNLALIKELSKDLKSTITDPKGAYSKSVNTFIDNINNQKGLVKQFYEQEFDDFANKKTYDKVYQTSINNAQVLLSNAAVNENVAAFEDMLQTAIGSSDTYKNVIKNISELIQGDDKIQGSLQRYANQNAKDIFAITDRQYAKAISDDLGVEFYRYAGGLIDTSRPFCKERDRKIFHQKEIEAWGDGKKTTGMKWPQSGTWAGHAKNTSSSTIFSLAGGYNCDHVLVAVGIKYVPIEVIKRCISQGFIDIEDLPENIKSKL